MKDIELRDSQAMDTQKSKDEVMELKELGEQYLNTMQRFCKECQKFDFQKLLQFSASEISEFSSKLLLGNMPRDPNAIHNPRAISQCWLCLRRYIHFEGDAPECSVYVTNVMSTPSRLNDVRVLPQSISQSIPAPCLAFTPKDESDLTFLDAFAWISRCDATRGLISHSSLSRFLNVSFVLECLGLCQKNHGMHCNESGQYVEGMKLLDCHNLEIVLNTKSVRYVALSYVWGKTERKGFQKHDDGSLKIDALSQTIQDSIVTTRLLGFRYLWVDKLCIDQTNKIEKHQQILQMDKIYAGAELTIVAAAGEDEESGLPGISIPRHWKTSRVIDFGSAQIFPFSLKHRRERQKSNWDTRGWTLQEGILSRRTIFFTRTQATFECNECTIPESLHVIGSESVGINANISQLHFRSPEQMLERYQHGVRFSKLVETFSGRSLSNQSDSFYAFAGIAAYFNKQEPPISNFHGIPILVRDSTINLSLNSALARGLSWYHTRKQPHNLNIQGAPYRRPLFPSWTWVGWCGKVQFERDPWQYGEIGCLITLKEIEFDDETKMRYESLIKEGQMQVFDASRVCALHFDATLLRLDSVSFCYLEGKITLEMQKVRLRMSEKIEDTVALENIHSGQFRLLALMSFEPKLSNYGIPTFFMVIKRSNEGYCRVGFMEIKFCGNLSLHQVRKWIRDRAEICSVKLL